MKYTIKVKLKSGAWQYVDVAPNKKIRDLHVISLIDSGVSRWDIRCDPRTDKNKEYK